MLSLLSRYGQDNGGASVAYHPWTLYYPWTLVASGNISLPSFLVWWYYIRVESSRVSRLLSWTPDPVVWEKVSSSR